MKTSIIIPNFNGLKHLRNCLDSLDHSSLKPDEIIVVDNGSQDDSLNWVRLNYPNIICIANKENKGFSFAVNQGIMMAKSEFVILLNNDIIVSTDWLKNLISPFSTDPLIFSCSSKMLQMNNKQIIDDAGDYYSILGWSIKRGDGLSTKYYCSDAYIFSSCAGAAAYRRNDIIKIGLFDESFFAYLEDLDLSFRANWYGYKHFYSSNAIVYHHGSSTSGSKHNAFKVELAARNNVFLIKKNFPFIMLLLNSLFICMGHFIKLVYFYSKNLHPFYLKGLYEGIKTKKKFDYSNFSWRTLLKIQFSLITSLRFLLRKLY